MSILGSQNAADLDFADEEPFDGEDGGDYATDDAGEDEGDLVVNLIGSRTLIIARAPEPRQS